MGLEYVQLVKQRLSMLAVLQDLSKVQNVLQFAYYETASEPHGCSQLCKTLLIPPPPPLSPTCRICLWQQQHLIIMPGSTSTFDLTISENHARCNVVFVGVPLSVAQISQLTLFSSRFQVRYSKACSKRGRFFRMSCVALTKLTWWEISNSRISG